MSYIVILAMAVYLRVSKEIIEAIEQGGSDLTELLRYISYYQRLSLDDSIEVIDYTLEKIFGEKEPYSLITYEGEILATPDGEAYIPDLLEFEFEDGTGFVLADPAVYKLPEEVAVAYELMSRVDYSQFKKRSKLKKDMLEDVWQDFERLRELFAEAAKEKQYIILL